MDRILTIADICAEAHRLDPQTYPSADPEECRKEVLRRYPPSPIVHFDPSSDEFLYHWSKELIKALDCSSDEAELERLTQDTVKFCKLGVAQ